MFSRAQDLDTFLGEVSVEARKRKPGTIDGRLADFAVKPDARALQFHLQFLGVRIVETLHRYYRHNLRLIARRSIPCCRWLAHQRPNSNADAGRFPMPPLTCRATFVIPTDAAEWSEWDKRHERQSRAGAGSESGDERVQSTQKYLEMCRLHST